MLRLLIAEGEQRQFLVAIQPGDDPRPATAESSGPGIKQDRARKVWGRCSIRTHLLRSFLSRF